MGTRTVGAGLLLLALWMLILSGQAFIELNSMVAAPGPVSEDDLSMFTEQWLHLVVKTIPTSASAPQVAATRVQYALVGCCLLALIIGGYGMSLLWRDLAAERSRN
jgi:hypothetical protein